MASSADSRLVLICEGGAHMVEYFHRNRVYPGAVVLKTSSFREMAPYLTPQDEVLLVINGLTDFTLLDVYALLDDLASFKDNLAGVAVASNVNLGVIPFDYYLYQGDLFYGEVREVVGGRVGEPLTIEVSHAKQPSRGKGKRSTKFSRDNFVHNPLMQRYTVFNSNSVNFLIYGESKRVSPATQESDVLLSKLIAVDLTTRRDIKC